MPDPSSKTITLEGQWRFHPRKLISPTQAQPPAPEFIEVPSVWNSPMGAGTGFATYALTVIPARPYKAPALKMREIGTAYRLYVNGILVGTRGRVGTDQAGSQPNYRANIISLPANAQKLDLVLHVSNFHNRWGGVWNAPVLGEAQAIRSLRERTLLFEQLLFAILLFMGIYHLAIFAYRPRDWSPFYFAVFCLLFAMRTALMGERFWLDLFPNTNWELAYKLEYLGYFLATPIWASFIRRVFPGEVSVWVEYITWAIGIPIALVTVFTPVMVYSGILFYKQGVTVSLGAYAVYALTRAFVKRRKGSFLFLGGWLIFFITVVMDLLHAADVIDSPPLTPLGLAVFALFQSLMLAGRFTGAFNAAEKMSLELEYKVVERTRDLKRARDLAEKSSRAKSDFLSIVSHEIRTPLNAVIGTADLLSEHALSGEQNRLVKMLKRSGRVLLTLINEILDISRIEAGKLELSSVTFDPRDVIDGAVEMMRLRANQKGLELTQHVAADVPEGLRGDPDRLHQILVNLLGNAVKFTGRGSVRLEAVHQGDYVLKIQVSDTGPGMPDHSELNPFEPFAQGDSSIRREFGGSGLGLAIVKRLVEMMQGEISYRERPGGGTIFEFTACFEPPEESVETKRPSETPAPTDKAGPRILIVEDNPDNQYLLQAFLTESRGEVRIASDGAHAVEIVKSDSFDLVLMDIQMPVMDGLTATRRIREWERQSGRRPLRILALSANATAQDVEKSRAAGCDDHLTKPISKKKLLRAVAKNPSDVNPTG